jgi:hypothetical protein
MPNKNENGKYKINMSCVIISIQYTRHMGNSETRQISFEGVQEFIQSYYSLSATTILINTFSLNEQNCIIQHTTLPNKEEEIINNLLENKSTISKIIIYGKNCRDNSVSKKIEQFKSLGILGRVKVEIYTAGLFEWLLLQEIYETELFPTAGGDSSQMIDLLKYK